MFYYGPLRLTTLDGGAVSRRACCHFYWAAYHSAAVPLDHLTLHHLTLELQIGRRGEACGYAVSHDPLGSSLCAPRGTRLLAFP